MNKAEEAAGLPPTAGYQYARQVGKQLFIAGQVPHDANAQLVGHGDPEVQAKQCLTNLRQLLVVHGFTEGDIQHLTVYVVGDQANLNSVWAAVKVWFENHVPPATLLGVARLGYEGQLVEIGATVIRSR